MTRTPSQIDKTKHTPEPWRVGKTAGVVIVTGHETGHDNADTIEYYGGHLIAESIGREADVRLIVAAPHLLDALERLVEISSRLPSDHQRHFQGSYEAARVAIAKATEGVA